MKKIVGLKRVTGSFTNQSTGEVINFDNLNVNFIETVNSDPALHGCAVFTEKIKYECAPAVLGLDYSDFDKLLDKEVYTEYTGGRYPKLERVVIKK